MQPGYPQTVVNTMKTQTIQYTNNLGNTIQNQFNTADNFMRQQYASGMGQIDSARNAFGNGINNVAAQGQIIQNQITAIPGQINTGMVNTVNPRLASLGNDLAPKAMQYIQDMGTNGINTGANYVNQPINSMNKFAMQSERALNQQYTIPNMGMSPPPIMPPSGANSGFCCCSPSICSSLCGSTNYNTGIHQSPGMGGGYGYQTNSSGCFGNCCSGICGSCSGVNGVNGANGGFCGGMCSFCPCCSTPSYGYPQMGPTSVETIQYNPYNQYNSNSGFCCGLC